jgi:transaldolase
MMREAVQSIGNGTKTELISASPRELLNIFHADSVGSHMITGTNDISKKLELLGKNLDEYSLDTVKIIYQDAKVAGFSI